MVRLSRRLRTRPIGVAVMVVVLLWGAGGAYGESQTITFRGGPLAPVLCPAAPDQTSITIVEGTWINVVNRTGAAATMEVDGIARETIAKDEGVSVLLSVGPHDMRLVPDCPTHGDMLPVVIDVTAAGPSPAPGQTPSAAPSAPGGAPGVASAPVTGSAYPTRTGGPVGDRPRPAGVGPPTGTSVPVSTASGPVPADPGRAVVEVAPYPVAAVEDPRGLNLLAVIGAICVFGVTAAIIRAILAQRNKRLLGL